MAKQAVAEQISIKAQAEQRDGLRDVHHQGKERGTSMSRYKLRRSIGVPAETAGNELDRIHGEYGKITPEILVDESRPKGAPLHAAFTWDDLQAGSAYRLIEARNIIRCVHIVDDEGEDRGCAYAHVDVVDEEESGGAYMPVAAIVEDVDMLASAISQLARKQAEAARSLADLEREARAAGKLKYVKGIGRARVATEEAVKELHDLS